MSRAPSPGSVTSHPLTSLEAGNDAGPSVTIGEEATSAKEKSRAIPLVATAKAKKGSRKTRHDARAAADELGKSVFDPLILLEAPRRCVAPTSWVGHIPFAFWLIRKARPKLLVELGTHWGNSYCAFCQAVAEGELGTNCYAVGAWRGDDQAEPYGPEALFDLRRHHDILYGAFSTLLQLSFDEALSSFGDGTIDLLHIDGRHTYEGVKQDFEAWRPKLSPNAIVLFHDTAVREGSFGVWQLWEELQSKHLSFNFPHCHGLGVLAMGEVRPALKPLFNARGRQATKIRKLFGAVGGALCENVEARLRLDCAERERAAAIAETAGLRREFAEIEALKDIGAKGLAELEAIRSNIAARQSADGARVAELLKRTQIEAASLREQLNELVLDATIAWTRYADLLKFAAHHASAKGPDEVDELREVVEEGLLEARKQKALLLSRRIATPPAAISVDAPERTILGSAALPAQPASLSVEPENVAYEFVWLTVGDELSERPRFTLVCASDETEVNFDDLVESIRRAAVRDRVEIFARVAIGRSIRDAEPIPTSKRGLLSELNEIILERAQGETVALVSVPGILRDGWMSGFEAVFEKQPLAAGVNGIVLNNTTKIGWSGASFSNESGWRLIEYELTKEDYRIESAVIIDGVAPGFVALEPDLFRELSGLAENCSSLAAAFLEFSNRITEAGFEVYQAPGARCKLSSAGESVAKGLFQRFQTAARNVPLQGFRRRPRVLVVDALTPMPDKDAGSVDVYWGMRLLQSLGYEVTFLPFYDSAHAGRYTDILRSDGVYCPVTPQLITPLHFVEHHGKDYDLIVLYRVTVAYLLVDLCRRVAPRSKIIFHTVDLHFLREERHAKLLQTPEAITQAKNTKVEELRCIRSVDATILVSRHEQELVGQYVPDAKRFLVPVMYPVPGRLAPRHGRDAVIFVGGFGHGPNADAVIYLLDEIWGLIKQQMPELTLFVAGSNTPDDILKRHDPARGVEIHGFVPDLRPLYARSLVNLAPLRFGAGVKGKIIGAMAVGVPTVATSVAVEGMGLTNGKNVLIGDDPREIADGVVRLCRDERLWNSVSDNAFVTAQAEFSVDAQITRWREILRSLSMPS